MDHFCGLLEAHVWFYRSDNRVHIWPTHRNRRKTAPELIVQQAFLRETIADNTAFLPGQWVTKQCSAQASYNCMVLYGVFIPKPVVSLELLLHDLSVRNLIMSLVEYSPVKPKKHMNKWFSCLQKEEYYVIEEGDIPKSCKVIRKIMPIFFR